MLARKALAGTAAAPKVYVENVFSAYLYTGDGSTQTITNNIDLSGEGGLVWIKERNNATTHALFDSANGISTVLSTNSTAGNTSTDGMNAFNNNGFAVKYPNTNDYGVNRSTQRYISWTFRKAKKFFDVVTFTTSSSTNTNQRISHNLGSTPGCIIVKNTGGTSGWPVWHRSLSSATDSYFMLNTTDPGTTYSNAWGTSGPTSTDFGINTNFFGTSANYVAYIFAHDAGGFGDSGSDSIIKCGSFNGSTGELDVDLGWEPQCVFMREATNGGKWEMIDNMRGFLVGDVDTRLAGNSNIAESTLDIIDPIPNGFRYKGNLGGTVVYIAIRRGPMKTPTSGTDVFAPIYANQSAGTKNTTNFPVDAMIIRSPSGGENNHLVSRLTGVSTDTTDSGKYMYTQSTAAEASGGITRGWDNTGFRATSGYAGYDVIYLPFRRAPGFFDVVCYTGTGSQRTVSHNLGVAPELIIVKSRNDANDWAVYSSAIGNTKNLRLNTTAAESSALDLWASTTPSATTFTVTGTFNIVNGSTVTYVAYLFASLSGVSKVGSYTGNGSSQTINCGFSAGARFVLIKRTDSTGDWPVFNSARGIVSGNDPYIRLNTTAAEVTDKDALDPDNSGFIVNETTGPNINTNGASYIYLAIA